MDEHGLPTVGAGVDYTKVPALEHKNTLTFLNNFIIHTTQFLNKFSNVCEEKLSELSGRVQRLDISLNILEAKLSSIPDLEGVQATTQYEPPSNVAGAAASTGAAPAAQPASSGPPPPVSQAGPTSNTAVNEPIPPPPSQPEAAASKGRKAKDDPRYQKYFKMKRLGVNPLQIAMEMKNHGLNPAIIDDEEAELPEDESGGGGAAMLGDASDSDSNSDTSSNSDDQDSDDSFGSD